MNSVIDTKFPLIAAFAISGTSWSCILFFYLLKLFYFSWNFLDSIFIWEHFCMIFIILDLLRCALWPKMWSLGEYSVWVWEECVFCCCYLKQFLILIMLFILNFKNWFKSLVIDLNKIARQVKALHETQSPLFYKIIGFYNYPSHIFLIRFAFYFLKNSSNLPPLSHRVR